MDEHNRDAMSSTGPLNRQTLHFKITTLFGALLVVTVLVLTLYGYRSSSKITLALCDDIVTQVTDHVIERTTAYLAPVSTMVEMNARMVGESAVPITANWRLRVYAQQVLKSFPQVSSFCIGDEQGDFVMIKRFPDGKFATKTIKHTSDGRKTFWTHQDPDSKLSKVQMVEDDDYDPRVRPWYRGAKKAMGTYWTDVYIMFTDKRPGITVSHPILDSAGHLVGVLGLDVELESVCGFLRTLKIGRRGVAFIFNDKDQLVAFPDESYTRDRDIETGTFNPVSVWDVKIDSIARSFERHITTGKAEIGLETNGEKYIASFKSFPKSFRKTWKVGVIVAEDDYIGGVKRINRNSLAIGLAVLLISATLATLLSRSISNPINIITQETEKVRQFNLDGGLGVVSNIKEIQLLQQAVRRMKATLKSFTRFAPEEIVREVVVNGRETMLGGEKREVTLLFSDLRNFTRFSEGTKPEDLITLLNAHFDAMVEIISNHGGFVVDFLGDSVFAVFGAPGDDPEHAKNAVQAAIDMQLAEKEMNHSSAAPNGAALEMGIGINTGACVVGNMGSRMRIKYGVVGHEVNFASRVESFTVGGQILISDATRTILEGYVTVVGPLEVQGKGIGETMKLWELRGIEGDDSRTLPSLDSGLIKVNEPLPLIIRKYSGKQLDPQGYPAKLLEISMTGAAIEADLDLQAFQSVQLELKTARDQTCLIDSKALGTRDNRFIHLVRFTGPDVSATKVISELVGVSGPSEPATG